MRNVLAVLGQMTLAAVVATAVSVASKSISSTDRAPAAFIWATASSRAGSSGMAASTIRAGAFFR